MHPVKQISGWISGQVEVHDSSGEGSAIKWALGSLEHYKLRRHRQSVQLTFIEDPTDQGTESIVRSVPFALLSLTGTFGLLLTYRYGGHFVETIVSLFIGLVLGQT